MDIYRNTMEKILDQQENDTLITNPKEPYRTFLRKMVYIFSAWKDRLRRAFGGKPNKGG